MPPRGTWVRAPRARSTRSGTCRTLAPQPVRTAMRRSGHPLAGNRLAQTFQQSFDSRHAFAKPADFALHAIHPIGHLIAERAHLDREARPSDRSSRREARSSHREAADWTPRSRAGSPPRCQSPSTHQESSSSPSRPSPLRDGASTPVRFHAPGLVRVVGIRPAQYRRKATRRRAWRFVLDEAHRLELDLVIAGEVDKVRGQLRSRLADPSHVPAPHRSRPCPLAPIPQSPQSP